MTLKSMTGFARTSGSHPPYRWAWEVKAVNAKGLDLRVRVPPGFDMIETEARTRLARRLGRGTCYATLTLQREGSTAQVRVNEQLLRALVASIGSIPIAGSLQPASLDGLLAVRGVVEVTETADDDVTIAAVAAATITVLDEALDELVATRVTEGAALGEVLDARLGAMQRLTDAAEATPGRKAEAVRARLQQSIETLTSATSALDPQRLHQEALLLAAKADIREELDRLKTHIVSARDLVLANQPVGRRLDFLAQELAREANTLCAKSNDPALTSIGMELRVEIEQFREQVQNIE
ncbi:MAG: YicC/YloC family endoribonuclease [Beijerinckiaceae bacterium]|nr:YicC/YloC family endoribonuclease [Beijerinckiaceae bacterium]